MSSVTLPLLAKNQALGNIRPLASLVSSKDPNSSSALTQTQDQLDKIQRILRDGITITADDIAGLVPPPVTIQEVACVHATTLDIVPAVAATGGAILWVRVTQDSTGNGQITWDAMGGAFKWAPADIETLANRVALFVFGGLKDPTDGVVRWFMTGIPMIGQTP